MKKAQERQSKEEVESKIMELVQAHEIEHTKYSGRIDVWIRGFRFLLYTASNRFFVPVTGRSGFGALQYLQRLIQKDENLSRLAQEREEQRKRHRPTPRGGQINLNAVAPQHKRDTRYSKLLQEGYE